MQCNALNCKAKGAFWEQKIGGSNPLVPNMAFGCGEKAASFSPCAFFAFCFALLNGIIAQLDRATAF